MTLDEINRLRALKSTNDGIAFDLEILKVADQLLDAAARLEQAERDHAAVLDSKLAEADKELSAVVDRLYRAERYVDGQDLRSDYRTATEMRAALERAEKENAEMRAALEQSERQLAASRAIARRESIGCDAWSDRAVKAEQANAVLRAECEASRLVSSEVRQLIGTLDSEGRVSPAHISALRAVEHRVQRFVAATDAAGALKGVE